MFVIKVIQILKYLSHEGILHVPVGCYLAVP